MGRPAEKTLFWGGGWGGIESERRENVIPSRDVAGGAAARPSARQLERGRLGESREGFAHPLSLWSESLPSKLSQGTLRIAGATRRTRLRSRGLSGTPGPTPRPWQQPESSASEGGETTAAHRVTWAAGCRGGNPSRRPQP